MKAKRLSILGECMVEVSAGDLTSSSVAAGLSYGGDTLNTAVYFARLGGAVDYLTALGDDSLSRWMLDCWRAEGVGCEFVQQTENAAPGLYLIELDESGERSFVYWREQSAARAMLQSSQQLAGLLATGADGSQIVYLSGITLALMSPEAHRVLFEFAADFRQRGGSIAFDSNYRPRLWRDADTAKAVYNQMYSHTDIALSTADDEYDLFGGRSAADIVQRLKVLGVPEIAVKDGDNGCSLYLGGGIANVPVQTVNVVDTTAAGDSFNAAYLLSRSLGMDALAAASSGHRLAGSVIQHRGAVIPMAAMPSRDSFGFTSL